jgi:hypothetical protein
MPIHGLLLYSLFLCSPCHGLRIALHVIAFHPAFILFCFMYGLSAINIAYMGCFTESER